MDIGLEEEILRFNYLDNISISNLSIGQGRIEFTPLQINQLTQIIANNGIYRPLYLYDSILDSNINKLKHLRIQ